MSFQIFTSIFHIYSVTDDENQTCCHLIWLMVLLDSSDFSFQNRNVKKMRKKTIYETEKRERRNLGPPRLLFISRSRSWRHVLPRPFVSWSCTEEDAKVETVVVRTHNAPKLHLGRHSTQRPLALLSSRRCSGQPGDNKVSRRRCGRCPLLWLDLAIQSTQLETPISLPKRRTRPSVRNSIVISLLLQSFQLEWPSNEMHRMVISIVG